ncbi:A/G-specific adenine glycosylase [bacterium]|nr:A/G-specific adenine glycosylase [bacterium]
MNTIFDIAFNDEHAPLREAFHQAQQAAPASTAAIQAFRTLILHYYRHHKRDFAWRTHTTPYFVTVSEIMLQQTQTHRVAGKFEAFVQTLPDFATLAQAPTAEVIRLWKGLGYNRRALALQKIAQRVTDEFGGVLPTETTTLETFPSIGKATARSIITYAFNQPTTFIETNVRTVFIYFFFPNEAAVTDAQLEPLVAAAVDTHNPREWYYALMDYGVMLKKTVGNVSRLSAHYAKQSKFEGSDRQIRGMILQALLDQPGIPADALPMILAKEPARVAKILAGLMQEGFIVERNQLLWLA